MKSSFFRSLLFGLLAAIVIVGGSNLIALLIFSDYKPRALAHEALLFFMFWATYAVLDARKRVQK
jgi:hypothetical protein